MNDLKLLRPPHAWSTQTKELVEMPRVRRWTAEQVRAMRAGTYDWKTHQEIPTG